MTDAHPKPLAKLVTTGALWMIAWRVVTRSLGMISTLVLARVLVPADFGLVAVATAFSQSVDTFSEVGLRDALVRHPQKDATLYDTAFTLQVARGILTAAVVALAAPYAGAWFGEPRLTPILLCLAALALVSAFENTAIAEFRREFRFGMEFALQLLPRVLQVATAIVAALLLHSYWALIIAIAVAKVSRLVATYLVHPHRPRFMLRRWRDLAGFSFWTWACSLAGVAWTRSDAFIIGPAFGAAVFGLYAVAWEVGGLPVSEIIVPATAALFPGFAEARRRGEPDALEPMFVIAFLSLLAVPLAIALSAASGPVVTVLLGARWAAARPLVAIIAINCVIAPLGYVASTLFTASGRVARLFAVILVSAIVRVAALAYAARGGNITVVTWVSVATIGFEALVFAVVLRAAGELRLRSQARAFLRIALAGAASLAATWWTGWGWHEATTQRAFPAFIEGAGVGLFAIAVFALAVTALWRLAGRPYGPEVRLAAMLRPLAARLTRRPRPA